MKKDESESIINQKQYLNDYLDKNEEFKSFQREEYIDATDILGLKQNPTKRASL